MTLTPSTNYNRGTIKRMRRHGREYDIVLDQYKTASKHPTPFGLLVRSHKTNRFVWFDRRRVHVPEYEKIAGPKFYDPAEIISYVENVEIVDEYMEYIIKRVRKNERPKYVMIHEFWKKEINAKSS